MRTLRRLAPILSCVALSLTAATIPAIASSSTDNGLSGIARDWAGQLLADVEIILLPDGPLSGPTARVRTDDRGRFLLSGVPDGVYRLAAIKDGYLASLTRVNTAFRSSVEVILNPMPGPGEPGAESIQEGRSWLLRVPRRSLLRDVERVALIDPAPEAANVAPAENSTSVPDAIQAELMHRVAVAGLGKTENQGPMEGTETRMQLASMLSEGTNLRLEGARESFSTAGTGGAATGQSRQKADALAMDVSVDAGSHSSVDVRAYYHDADLALATGDASGERNSQRSWGYDATWAMQLDAASRLAVQLDYLDQSIDTGAAEFTRAGNSNRSIGAETGYEVLADDHHLIRVGFRAQRLDLALPLVRSGGGGSAFLAVSGAAGWSATLDVEDAWSVGSGTTVIYGLGVRQALDAVNSTLVVPRAGAEWSGRRLQVRGVLSYHTLPIDGSAAGSERDALPGQIRLDQPVGYDVQVAAPVGLGWTASARYQDLPVQPAYLGLRQGSASDTYYLSNGNVADRRASLLLERPGSFGTFSIRLTDGRAEGYVSDAILWASPYRILSERELRYRSAAAQLTFQKTGTGLVVEWVEMAERQPDSQGVPRHVNRYVDAEFQQDLIRFGFLDARCRLVVAARLGPGGASDGRHAERDLLALQRRLSAGVAVLF